MKYLHFFIWLHRLLAYFLIKLLSYSVLATYYLIYQNLGCLVEVLTINLHHYINSLFFLFHFPMMRIEYYFKIAPSISLKYHLLALKLHSKFSLVISFLIFSTFPIYYSGFKTLLQSSAISHVLRNVFHKYPNHICNYFHLVCFGFM